MTETTLPELRYEPDPDAPRSALVYTFDVQSEETGIAGLLRRLAEHGIDFKDLHSSESSLEEIFVSLVHGNPANAPALKPSSGAGNGLPAAWDGSALERDGSRRGDGQ